ncbi:MAG TPA: saccharopine dehydrogenase NADP-binding domain-containing protein, partial [Steroidobacteraceae bacterium]|nr:saccharopine dehydrogenase NADP-binding domain-containing protein [Steroidobacteraceae bacterium]
MDQEMNAGCFGGRLLILGFGSIGKTLLPLVLRHVDVPVERVAIIAADPANEDLAQQSGVAFEAVRLTPDNFAAELGSRLRAGDVLINVSVNVSSLDLIEFCLRHGVLYVDSSIEPWPGGCDDASLTPAQRTNYAMREAVLALQRRLGRGATAVVDHGANPGLVSHFAKQAIVEMARANAVFRQMPGSRAEWAALVAGLDIKLIQVSERDTQAASVPKVPGEFVNTWSIEGFTSEAVQPAELGWGTHERALPTDAVQHDSGCRSAIFLARPGALTQVRSWAPRAGGFNGLLISHDEAISMADYYTHRTDAGVVHRPTVHYAYHPCDDALLSMHEFAGREWQLQESERLLEDEIIRGRDELGVLIGSGRYGAYWYGSDLTIDAARALVPVGNATTLQVAAGVLAGLVWAIEHPDRGVVEPDELGHERCLEVARPYLGLLRGTATDWTPVRDRQALFPEQIDTRDPWQFVNVRVNPIGVPVARSDVGAPARRAMGATAQHPRAARKGAPAA